MNKVTLRRMPMGLVVAGLVLLTGCSFAPKYERPAAPINPQWNMAAVQQPGQEPVASSASLDWQTFVTDESLRKLIDTAIANNRDLRQSLLNVEAARAQYRVQRAEQLPGINADGSGSRQHVPADMSPTQQAGVQSEWRAGVGLASFEIDLFGRVRNLSEAALQEYLSTEAGARSAQISLVAEVIEAYLTRNGAQQRRVLTVDTLEARETSLKLISQRRELGVGSALDYQEALGLTQQAKADLERAEREVRQSTNALGLLVGVSDINALLPVQPSSDHALVQNLAPGAPAELLTYRPDIQAAEHRLQGRNADIGAARAAFFPRISLTGMFGTASTDISNLFSSGQRAWSFAPQITLPIFAGGSNVANLDLATVRKDMAIAEYEKTIQTAFREVSDALAATDTLQREEVAQRGLAESSGEAQRLSEARYKGGVDNYLRYLDAQRRAFASQTTLIEVQTQRQIALARLFRSLGGGWSDVTVVGANEVTISAR